MMEATNHFKIAVKLYNEGYGLLPLKDNKEPIGPWKHLQTKTKSPIEMANSKNYGLICGVNDVEILDLDFKVLETEEEKDNLYNETLLFIEENIKDASNKLALYETISGGYHLLYKTKKKEGNQVLAKIKIDKTLFETRGVGGYGYLYPDNQVWGRDYFSLKYITNEERSLLFKYFKSFDERKTVMKNLDEHYKKDLSFSSIEIINRYNNDNSILDIVADDFKIVRNSKIGYVILRNGDTKSKSSGYVYHDSGGMYLFSTNTQYPAETYISPFTANMIKNFKGDFKTAFKDLVRKEPSVVKDCLPKIEKYKSQLTEKELKSLAIEMRSESYDINSYREVCSHLSLDKEILNEYWYSSANDDEAKVIIYKLNEKIAPKNSFVFANFSDHPRNFKNYREYLGNILSYIPICDRFVRKNPDKSIDYSQTKSLNDLYLDLKDHGMKINDSDYKRIIDSDYIDKLQPLTILYNQLQLTPWDGTDRIRDVIRSANLAGDFEHNLYLLNKFFCTTYGFAFRGIDPLIPDECYSRVVAILVNEQKGTGKSTFWKKLGLSGVVKKTTGITGAEFYCETQGDLPSDKMQFKLEQVSNMLYQFDDLTDVMIKATGAFRSLISSTMLSVRYLYMSKTHSLQRRVTFCGSSNHIGLIKDPSENRFMPFLQKGSVDIKLFNSIDKFQFWAQIRDQVANQKEKVYFNSEDLKLINEQAQEFVYKSPLEDSLSILLEYDPKARLTFSSIRESVNQLGHRLVSDSLLGSSLNKMTPEGEKTRKKINGSNYYCFAYKK